jgi:hypothetical protein
VNARKLAVVAGLLLVTYGLGPAAAAPPAKGDSNAGVPQNWDKVLPPAQRFTVLEAFNNEAVRDNETGLVWEQSPATIAEPWFNARGACAIKNVGGRIGWRLPSLPELSSLVDPSVGSLPVHRGPDRLCVILHDQPGQPSRRASRCPRATLGRPRHSPSGPIVYTTMFEARQ